MNYLFENKIKIVPDSSSLKWCLVEENREGDKSRTFYPFATSLYFSIPELTVTRNLEVRDETQTLGEAVREYIVISGNLAPQNVGSMKSKATEYSFLGTDRVLKNIVLEIISDSIEGCRISAHPSYTPPPASFQTDANPDILYFSLTVSEERIKRLAGLIEAGGQRTFELTVGGVDGFYTEDQFHNDAYLIKILTDKQSIHAETSEPFTPFVAGRVGRITLHLRSTNGCKDNQAP